jgi:UDP-glucuronate 4-epimerase
MAKYLVTGAAGFIAFKVIDLLLQEGHTVIGLDNLNDAYDLRLKEWRLEKLRVNRNFIFHHQDISDLPTAKGIVKENGSIQAVINLAARAGVRTSVENPWLYYESNVIGTLNMLEICRQCDIPKFVMASTSSIYGLNPPLPTPEDADSSHPLQPYAASKKAAETLAYSYHYLYGLDVTVFRYFTVYGPAGRPDLFLFRFVQWIAENRPVRVSGDGNQTRGCTYLDDIAQGTLLGLKPVGYEIFNLGGEQVISINDFISRLEVLLNKKASKEFYPRNQADVLENWADISKARKLLGWEPKTTLDKGIAELVDWYMAERSWASQILTP